MNGLYTYLSFAVASVVGGGVYTLYGGRTLFIGTSIMCFCWSLLMFIYIRFRKETGYERKGSGYHNKRFGNEIVVLETNEIKQEQEQGCDGLTP